MKVVYFCLKINVKFVLYRNLFLLYDFLSLEYLRLTWAKCSLRTCVAQLEGELIAHKNCIEERNIFIKQFLHWSLCKNKQLLFTYTSHFDFDLKPTLISTFWLISRIVWFTSWITCRKWRLSLRETKWIPRT